VNASLLINALGHSAGVLIFSIFLVLLIQDRATQRDRATDRATRRLRGGFKSLLAAALALAWNLASLIVLGLNDPNTTFGAITIAAGFSVLSLLPAVLFDLCLADSPLLGPRWDRRYRTLVHAGYALSIAATILHIAELFQHNAPYHAWGLDLITIGFGVLTVIAAWQIWREDRAPAAEPTPNHIATAARPVTQLPRQASRLVGTMSLLLLAISFVHLGGAHDQLIWSHELAFHHAAIPLALLILLQDYRFLLLDAFLRFLANVLLAALFVSAAVVAWREGWLPNASTPFHLALLLAGASLTLIVFALLRTLVQRLLTRVVFRRPASEALLAALQTTVRNEDEYLALVAASLAGFMGAESNWVASPDLEHPGAEAIVPLTVRPGLTRYLLLGRRSGGRRYLSEDLQALQRAAGVAAEQLEQHRESELRRLVAQAELRALQSQIHPHFLFNALNTLYGIIPRDARGARETVLNLADIFRYFLETKKTVVPLEEELAIVRAYLEVERMRLGEKLRVEIDVTPEALSTPIPILSIQPLVENAIKHGIAATTGPGLVRIAASIEGSQLRVSVSDTGPGFTASRKTETGVGLENVTRRLELSYGAAARLEIQPNQESGGAEVRFTIPTSAPASSSASVRPAPAPALNEVLR
jgi:two-component system LytT family sensor kinase